jgi:hypothetical protein
MEFQQGVGYVIRAFNFGYIADSWGPAPYAKALNAPAGSQEDYFPPFDSQEDIYKGIIEELKTANTLLSKPTEPVQRDQRRCRCYLPGRSGTSGGNLQIRLCLDIT